MNQTVSKPDDETLSPKIRLRASYTEGRDAYHEGWHLDECPYISGDNKRAWYTGWLDERMKAKFGTTFAEYGIEWP